MSYAFGYAVHQFSYCLDRAMYLPRGGLGVLGAKQRPGFGEVMVDQTELPGGILT